MQAIKDGLRDGTIDVITTDHAHATQEKQQEFTEAPFGIVGLETALSLTLALVEEGVLTLESAIDKLSTAPAKAFSLNAGTLAVGAPADVAIVDPDRQWEVDPSRFRSKSRNTPLCGLDSQGRVTTTIVSAAWVYELIVPGSRRRTNDCAPKD